MSDEYCVNDGFDTTCHSAAAFIKKAMPTKESGRLLEEYSDNYKGTCMKCAAGYKGECGGDKVGGGSASSTLA